MIQRSTIRIFLFALLLLHTTCNIVGVAQAQGDSSSSVDLEPFRVYPAPSFSCGWGDVLAAIARAKLVRDAAQACLREDNILFQLCGFAIDDPSNDVTLFSTAECRGTYVLVPGGRITFSAFNPSSAEVQQCVQQVLQQNNGGCLVQALQVAGFPNVQSIQVTEDAPQAAPVTPPEPTAAPTAAPITSQPTKGPTTSQPTKGPTQSPSTAAPATAAPSTQPPTTEAPVPVPTQSPITDSPTVSPVTDSPTASPVTDSPTASPVTDSPTEKPTTQAPSATEVQETKSPQSETAPSPTNAPFASSSNTNAPTKGNDGGGGDDNNDTTITDVARGEGDASIEQNNSMVGTIVGATVAGAVFVAVFAFIAWRRRSDNDDDVDSDYNRKMGAAEVYALPQKTYSLDGDNMYDDPGDNDDHDDDDDDDVEMGSVMGLATLDSLQPASPSSTVHSRSGGLRLLSTMPVILAFQSKSSNNNSNNSSTVVVTGRAGGAGHDELNTTIATAALSHNNSSLREEDGSLSSSFEEAGGTKAEHDKEDDDSPLVDIAAMNNSNSDSDVDDDRRGILTAATGLQTYDTRSVLTNENKTRVATELSQEVMIVPDDEDDDTLNNSGAAWKNRWIRPSIVASLQSLRPGGKNKSNTKYSNNELYISGDSSSARSPSPPLDFGDPDNIIAMAEDQDDESTDFGPGQDDWDPDDNQVSASDDMSNGELSFMAKTSSRRSSPNSNSSEQQQGEELDGLDILEKLRLSPTPTEVKSSIRRKMFTPRGFLHKG